MTGRAIAARELILGGQKSGKSRRAELLARQWLALSASHQALLLATGQPWDDEMRTRIARHQQERAERVPGLRTVDAPKDLAAAIAQHSRADTLIVIDCLTLWLTNWLMPVLPPAAAEENKASAQSWSGQSALFFDALTQAPGPVVLVGNEIGLGVIPMGREVRAFVDALGVLNQRAAQACERVTLVAAGLPLYLKGAP